MLRKQQDFTQKLRICHKPFDKKLQSMFAQLIVGGDCDILLGVMYNAIFPIAVHSLTNGLTIYELQVIPHDSEVNSIIGGPHESFDLMAQQVGGANVLFSQLMQTLDNYKSFGPPKVSKTLMTQEDEEFQKVHIEWELGEVAEDLFDGTDVMEVLENREENNMEEIDAMNDDVELPLDDVSTVHCPDCGADVIDFFGGRRYLLFFVYH